MIQSSFDTKPDYYDQAKIQLLQDLLCENIEELLIALDVRFRKSYKVAYGPCPIHGGDNPSAWNLYWDGDHTKGNYICVTRKCEQVFKRTIIGFVRGVLSRQGGWEKPGDTPVSFKEALLWCCNFLGQTWPTLRPSEELEKRIFTRSVSLAKRERIIHDTGITRAHIRSRLHIPSKYFIDRGFTPEILDRYDVGLCTTPGKPMTGRVVVPCYDPTYSFVVGVTGRSPHDKCLKCNSYHNPDWNCPNYHWSKWFNSTGFPKESCLFNFWFSREAIERTSVAVLVEGPPDIFRLAEAGINNAVGLLGVKLHDGQQCLLETTGVMTIILLLNSDNAGQEAIQELSKRLDQRYKVLCPTLPGKDVAELPATQVCDIILPLIEKYKWPK